MKSNPYCRYTWRYVGDLPIHHLSQKEQIKVLKSIIILTFGELDDIDHMLDWIDINDPISFSEDEWILKEFGIQIIRDKDVDTSIVYTHKRH